VSSLKLGNFYLNNREGNDLKTYLSAIYCILCLT